MPRVWPISKPFWHSQIAVIFHPLPWKILFLPSSQTPLLCREYLFVWAVRAARCVKNLYTETHLLLAAKNRTLLTEISLDLSLFPGTFFCLLEQNP